MSPPPAASLASSIFEAIERHFHGIVSLPGLACQSPLAYASQEEFAAVVSPIISAATAPATRHAALAEALEDLLTAVDSFTYERDGRLYPDQGPLDQPIVDAIAAARSVLAMP